MLILRLAPNNNPCMHGGANGTRGNLGPTPSSARISGERLDPQSMWLKIFAFEHSNSAAAVMSTRVRPL
jgi:hypothetical protein